MAKTRDESMEEAIEIMKLVRQLIHLSGFELIADMEHGCAILKDTANNEEFCFNTEGGILNEQ